MTQNLKKYFLNHLKLASTITVILIVSIIAFVLLGGLGYYYINQVKSYQNDMYNNALVPGFQASQIKSDLMESGLNITKIVYIGYNKDYVQKVEKLDIEIRDLIKKYEDRGLDDKEKAYLDKVKKTYNTYSRFWSQIKLKLSKGENLTTDDMNTFSKLSDNADTAVNDIISYGMQDATDLNNTSNQKAVYSLMTFVIVAVSAILLLLVLSIFVIALIRISIKEFKGHLGSIAAGDLSVRPDASGTNEFGIMRRSLINTIENFKDTLGSTIHTSKTVSERAVKLSGLSAEISGSSQEVTAVVQQVAEDASSQTDNLINISKSISDFGNKISKITKLIEEVSANTGAIDSNVAFGNESFRTLIDSINQMKGSFNSVDSGAAALGSNIKEIDDIVNFINGISEQTNLLALNAAIEAARAGESGKGFSVVAEEIRKLAEQSKKSSEHIRILVKRITDDSTTVVAAANHMSNELNSQSETVERSITVFDAILNSVHEIIPKVQSVQKMAEEIEKDKNVIIVKVNEVSEFANGLSANTQEMAATSQDVSNATVKIAEAAQVLEETSDKLMESIGKFKL